MVYGGKNDAKQSVLISSKRDGLFYFCHRFLVLVIASAIGMASSEDNKNSRSCSFAANLYLRLRMSLWMSSFVPKVPSKLLVSWLS